MNSRQTPHISVCICTYRRPKYLLRLLEDLCRQKTTDLFTYSIVVVDNDGCRSAESVVASFAASTPIRIIYCVEPQQNIALARNRAWKVATGELISFIDDDEFPITDWLSTLFKALQKYDVDGVLGPVKPHFDEGTPRWVVEGGFYDRPSYPTGFVIDWRKGRTGNVLMKKGIVWPGEEIFRPQFRTGEDQDFFRRQIEKGHVFIWCHEAMAYEVVPPLRCTRWFMLRRSLLRGASTLCHPTFGARDVANSLVAVPAYAAALPFALLLGQGKFMLLLVKLFDHLGRLLALARINPVKAPYVTD